MRGEREPSPRPQTITHEAFLEKAQPVLTALADGPFPYSALQYRCGMRRVTVARISLGLQSLGMVTLTRIGEDIRVELIQKTAPD
jgi:DNA-binding IclR family transcriptional regulator